MTEPGTVVGFQADNLHSTAQQPGWSVLVIGRAALVNEPAHLAQRHATDPRPGSRSATASYLSIEPELVTEQWLEL
ncbi:hypothetical protein ACIG5E_36695 [Kitasatospora sp. NPDC053057]|uniref:hypothetical protein n=1 Tax=Kitasatospora sp. NPDC053057 TaxID=3364062 RepID=UPI0037C856DF